MKTILNFVNGAETPPLSGDYFPTDDPAIGAPYALVPDSDERDLDVAVEAAVKAFPAWRDLGGEKRGDLLDKLADLLEPHAEEFAQAECVDTGKPIWLCRTVDIFRGIANLRVFADAARNFRGESFHKPNATPATDSYVLREPIGVVATISPWNLPLLLFTWKVAPALAAGNCVIAKPSEVTPMTASMLGPLVAQAGFPPGVFNILHGKGPKIGAAITKHPKIAAISFTGGTATGTEIYSGAARMLKKVSLELGGKNPTVVFDDCNFDLAVEGAAKAAFTNQGQVCLCGSRILVQESLYPKFKEALLAKAEALKPADPLLPDTRFAAMVSRQHMEKVLGCIALAREEGGKLLVGGERAQLEGRCANGYFLEPTLFENLPANCRTNQEEIFGPVATLLPFRTEEETVALANCTPYGLSSSIWTESAERARRVAAQLESGTVWLNCWNIRDLDLPFGGVKKSGVGREGKWRAMEFFTQEKTVTRLI
jgi:aminomuconate-semialdehyde/2-hydroxymuconate-6-semialdehyde dehydrogenase